MAARTLAPSRQERLAGKTPASWYCGKHHMQELLASMGLRGSIWAKDVDKDVYWARLQQSIENPNAVLMLHFCGHYTHIYAIREYALDPSSYAARLQPGSSSGRCREILTTRVYQGGREWMDFDDSLWPKVMGNKKSMYGVMEITTTRALENVKGIQARSVEGRAAVLKPLSRATLNRLAMRQKIHK